MTLGHMHVDRWRFEEYSTAENEKSDHAGKRFHSTRDNARAYCEGRT